MNILNYISENWVEVLFAITAVISAASAIAALTPTPKDDLVIAKIRKFINLLALNIGNAKK